MINLMFNVIHYLHVYRLNSVFWLLTPLSNSDLKGKSRLKWNFMSSVILFSQLWLFQVENILIGPNKEYVLCDFGSAFKGNLDPEVETHLSYFQVSLGNFTGLLHFIHFAFDCRQVFTLNLIFYYILNFRLTDTILSKKISISEYISHSTYYLGAISLSRSIRKEIIRILPMVHILTQHECYFNILTQSQTYTSIQRPKKLWYC